MDSRSAQPQGATSVEIQAKPASKYQLPRDWQWSLYERLRPKAPHVPPGPWTLLVRFTREFVFRTHDILKPRQGGKIEFKVVPPPGEPPDDE
jgi:hypothetical protein